MLSLKYRHLPGKLAEIYSLLFFGQRKCQLICVCVARRHLILNVGSVVARQRRDGHSRARTLFGR